MVGLWFHTVVSDQKKQVLIKENRNYVIFENKLIYSKEYGRIKISVFLDEVREMYRIIPAI